MSNTNNNSFEKDYLYIKNVITICSEKSYRLSHSECDMIFNFLYPVEVSSSLHLEKIEEIKQLLEKYHTIIPECYHYNF
jgi:hypothetical protein